MKIEKTPRTRPANRALQVYLDSSDYSVLSKAMVDTDHPDANVFQDLCQFVDQGRIEIRFSAVHVVEMAHLDSDSREFALSRARCLQRLSKGKCFRFWTEIPAAECINLLSNQPVYEGVFRDNGFWHPDFSDMASSLKQFLVDEFKEIAVKSSANRQQRRAFERRYFPNGHLGSEGIRILQVQRSELLAALSEQFPFSERFYREDLMLQFASGKASATEIVEEMSVVFRDVERFIGWTYDTRDKERRLVLWLRDYGSDLASKVEALRVKLDKVIRPLLGAPDVKKRMLGLLEEKIPELRLSRLTEIESDLKAANPSATPHDENWTSIRNSPLGSVPSLDVYIYIFLEYFRRNLQMNRKPKPSDAADLFHLAHLPYCDLFRADGDTAEVARPLAPPFSNLVVSKLRELPGEIERALKKHEASS